MESRPDIVTNGEIFPFSPFFPAVLSLNGKLLLAIWETRHDGIFERFSRPPPSRWQIIKERSRFAEVAHFIVYYRGQIKSWKCPSPQHQRDRQMVFIARKNEDWHLHTSSIKENICLYSSHNFILVEISKNWLPVFTLLDFQRQKFYERWIVMIN